MIEELICPGVEFPPRYYDIDPEVLSIIRWIDTSNTVLKCALEDYHRKYQDIAELKLNLQYLAEMQEVQDSARMKEEEYNRAQEPHKSYVDNDGFYTFDRPVAKELV